MTPHVEAIADEYARYKALGEAAIAQLGDEELALTASDGGNSVIAIAWHVFLAKQIRSGGWSCLSIPLGESVAHNARGADESAKAHARALESAHPVEPPPV